MANNPDHLDLEKRVAEVAKTFGKPHQTESLDDFRYGRTSNMSDQYSAKRRTIGEIALLMLVFFIYAGDMAPMVNEAHYLVKAKNFWDASWCQNDLFAASGKAHTTFYVLLGWPTKFFSLAATAWIGRIVGWLLLAIGLQRLSASLISQSYSCVGVALLWIAGIEYGNLAGEWVVGGVEAKVPAYGFVLMAAAEIVRRHWNRVWVLLGIASAFHVLTGGWSVVAATVAWFATEAKRDDRHALITRWLFVGGAIALFGLVPALWLTMGADPQASASAARIYSYFRIRHHLLPADFHPVWYFRHTLLLLATFWLHFQWLRGKESTAGARSFGWFAFGSIGIASVGLLVGLLPTFAPDLAAKLLRYYWFRLSDAVVPLLLAITAMQFICRQNPLSEDEPFSPQRVSAGLLGASVLAFLFSAFTTWELGVPPSASHRLLGYQVDASVAQQRAAFDDWRSVCQWAKHATPKDELFLTPRHQQTFKWYAHRAEVVNWKDVPQDANTLNEWQARFTEIFPRRLRKNRTTIKYSSLRNYRKKYGARFMIVDRRITGQNLPLVRVYPIQDDQNKTYAVYELPY